MYQFSDAIQRGQVGCLPHGSDYMVMWSIKNRVLLSSPTIFGHQNIGIRSEYFENYHKSAEFSLSPHVNGSLKLYLGHESSIEH